MQIIENQFDLQFYNLRFTIEVTPLSFITPITLSLYHFILYFAGSTSIQ